MEYQCIVYLVHVDANNMKDDLGRHDFRGRIPLKAEHIHLGQRYFYVNDVVHTPHLPYCAELLVTETEL
jgi:hypothetical protein